MASLQLGGAEEEVERAPEAEDDEALRREDEEGRSGGLEGEDKPWPRLRSSERGFGARA